MDLYSTEMSKLFTNICTCILGGIVALILLVQPVQAKSDKGLSALLEQSCLDCHDDDIRKGGLSIESLDFPVTSQNANTWLKCLEQIERGFMPPQGKKQPSDILRKTTVLELENYLVAYHKAQPVEDHQAVLRRLNRSEYRNTVRDLLKIEEGWDPTTEFPGDERSHGFATNGEKLVTSNFLLRKYLDAAEGLIERAVHFGPRPEVRKWTMSPPFDRTTGQETSQAAGYFRKLNIPQSYQDLCQRIGAGGAPYRGYHPLDDLSAEGVAEAGWYKMRVEVEAKFQHSFQYDYFTRWKPLWDGSVSAGNMQRMA